MLRPFVSAAVPPLLGLLLGACAVPLPPATPAPAHGLERVWLETLGLE